MKLTKIAGVVVSLGAASGAFAQATMPTELTTMFTEIGEVAGLAVAAGIVLFAGYRGGIAALSAAKRMVSKAGL